MKFLIVDDLPVMRSIISTLLRDLGCSNYKEAENGNSALRLLRTEKFDAVLTDWNMPGMDGLDLINAIRRDPNLKHIPVLMITAEGKKDNVLAAARAGADAYIVKPFNVSTLHSKLSHIIGKRKQLLHNEKMAQHQMSAG